MSGCRASGGGAGSIHSVGIGDHHGRSALAGVGDARHLHSPAFGRDLQRIEHVGRHHEPGRQVTRKPLAFVSGDERADPLVHGVDLRRIQGRQLRAQQAAMVRRHADHPPGAVEPLGLERQHPAGERNRGPGVAVADQGRNARKSNGDGVALQGRKAGRELGHLAIEHRFRRQVERVRVPRRDLTDQESQVLARLFGCAAAGRLPLWCSGHRRRQSDREDDCEHTRHSGGLDDRRASRVASFLTVS
jgi:hypothetical protein